MEKLYKKQKTENQGREKEYISEGDSDKINIYLFLDKINQIKGLSGQGIS